MRELIGIPYLDRGRTVAGCDCWGLAMLYHAERGVTLPDFADAYESAEQSQSVASVVAAHRADAGWLEVSPQDWAPGDLLLMRMHGHPCHVGVFVGGGMFLHTLRGHNSALQRLSDVRYRSRIVGAWRWLR